MKGLRVPMPVQILLMVAALTFGGAYLLLGQQAPSEESDWPWKVVTESKVFLNGAPVGKLGNLSPLSNKLGVQLEKNRRAAKTGNFVDQVMIVADPDTSIGRIGELNESIVEGTGEPILVRKSSLDKPTTNPKPSPFALIVATENVDMEKARRLASLPESELESVGHRVSFITGTNPGFLRFARTYESSIEIGSDGKYYLNEPTARLEGRSSSNVGSRILNPIPRASNSNLMPSVAPLKQKALTRAEFSSAVAKLVSTANSESQEIFIIASDKARYDSLLQILEGIPTDARIIVLIRQIESR